MKRTNTVADALNTNIAQVDPGDGLPVIPIPLDGRMPGYPGPAGPGVPEGGTTGQMIEKTSDGSTRWVTLTKSKFGLDNVDNTSDLDKPISAATQTALNAKASNIELAAKADLVGGKIPVAQIPVEATVTDSNVAAVVNGAQTGPAIDARINMQVSPQVEQIVADAIAADQTIVDAAAAAVDANPTIAGLEAAKWAQGGLAATTPVNGPLGSIKDGAHRVSSDGRAVELALPNGRAGWLTQVSLSDFGIQVYMSILGTSVRLWSTVTSSWGSWVNPANVYTDAAMETVKWYRGGMAADTPVNGALGSIKDGEWRVTSDTLAGQLSLPGARAGKFTQVSFGDFGLQVHETILGTNTRIWSASSNGWGAWNNPANKYTDDLVAAVTWYRGGLLATDPINGPIGSMLDGDYRVTSDTRAIELGLPDGLAGNFKQVSFGTFSFQTYTNLLGTSSRMWSESGNDWGAWAKPAQGSSSAVDPSPSSGSKLVPLALTLGQGNTDYPVTSGTSRLPMWWGAPVSRFRVHIRNINPRENFVRTGVVTFGEGLWLGVDSTGDGQATGLKQIVGAFTTPENGDGWVSGWIEEELPADSKHLLSYSFTATGTVQSCEGGSWRAAGDGLVASSNTATWTRSLDAPFDIWIEAETPSTVPVVAVVGDSLSAGTTATMPVLDSPMSQHMRAWGGLPIHYAAVGDTFNSYNGNGGAGSEDYKKERWLHLAKPDSVLLALGSNDLFGQAQSLANMKTRFAQTLAWVKSAISETVFLSTITPRNLELGATEDVRREYNIWLKQQNQPGGVARATFDFSAAISSDNETINAEFNGDGIHLNTAGYAAEAGTLKNLTSPAVMYRV